MDTREQEEYRTLLISNFYKVLVIGLLGQVQRCIWAVPYICSSAYTLLYVIKSVLNCVVHII